MSKLVSKLLSLLKEKEAEVSKYRLLGRALASYGWNGQAAWMNHNDFYYWLQELSGQGLDFDPPYSLPVERRIVVYLKEINIKIPGWTDSGSTNWSNP